MTTPQLLENIQKEIVKSFLHIPSTMARLFDNNVLEQFKGPQESFGNEEEKKNLSIEEETLDSLISSASEVSDNDINLLKKIKEKSKEKKLAIDLFNGKAAEHFLVNRVDRDIFDLKYHKNIIYNYEYNYSKLDEKLPQSDEEYNDLIKFLNDNHEILKFFKSMNMNLEGEIDFIINNVKKNDIIKVLNDESKKYFVFGDPNLFNKENYEIFGEVTINLFHPLNYIKKFKQILRYITLIKLYENNPNYFKKKRNVKKVDRAIMVITNGNYIEFIDQLALSKIFTSDNNYEDFKTDSIYEIVKCKKFKEEIDEYEKFIKSEKDLNNNYKAKLSKLVEMQNMKDLKKSYFELKDKTQKSSHKILLKSRTINILRLLKASKIPFMICYFPKIGGELPYNLFKDQAIFITRTKKDGNYIYNFENEKFSDTFVTKKDFDDLKQKYDDLSKKFEELQKKINNMKQ